MSSYNRMFILSQTINNFANQEGEGRTQQEEHFGVPWQLCWKRSTSKKFSCWLHCLKIKDEHVRWSVTTDCIFRVATSGGDQKSISTSHVFRGIQNGEHATFDLQHLLNGSAANGMVALECEVNIKEITGVASKRKLEFNVPLDNRTDVVLLVGGEKFHVLKGMLAYYSDFFYRLFFGDFAEKDKKEITIEAEAESFHFLLESIYGSDSIRLGTIENILMLADQYDVPLVKERCEKFLIENNEMDKKEKFRLATKYNLPDYVKKCLDSVKKLEDALAFLPENLKEVDDATLATIFRTVHHGAVVIL